MQGSAANGSHRTGVVALLGRPGSVCEGGSATMAALVGNGVSSVRDAHESRTVRSATKGGATRWASDPWASDPRDAGSLVRLGGACRIVWDELLGLLVGTNQTAAIDESTVRSAAKGHGQDGLVSLGFGSLGFGSARRREPRSASEI
jgi:hypothetical protein